MEDTIAKKQTIHNLSNYSHILKYAYDKGIKELDFPPTMFVNPSTANKHYFEGMLRGLVNIAHWYGIRLKSTDEYLSKIIRDN